MIPVLRLVRIRGSLLYIVVDKQEILRDNTFQMQW